MKWKFLYIDEDCIPHGTNNEELANRIAESAAIVINVETGEHICNWPNAPAKTQPIEEIEHPEDWLTSIDPADEEEEEDK